MIIGIGVDLVDKNRMDIIFKKYGTKLIHRVLHPDEITNKIKSDRLAKRFAAKEACVKALGCGFTRGITLKNIAIFNDNLGKPYIKLFKQALLEYNKIKGKNILLSISDEKNMAVAMVIIEK
ncbi:MAG: holo-ACP synthase [Gammaproteobacteria bacterium]|nr:MAG: holo-ACP synthase [Gammaproteobacteria bacterium]